LEEKNEPPEERAL